MRHVRNVRLRPLLVVVGVVVWLTATATPAHAKGAVAVTVSGPGIADVRLTYTERAGDVDLDALTEAASFYPLVFGTDGPPLPLAGGAPAGELGPRYVLSFDLGESRVIEYAYPFAAAGPYVEMPPGQQVYEIPVAPGWLRVDSSLRSGLVTLGAAGPPPAADASPAAAVTAASATAAWGGPGLIAVGALAVGVALVAGWLWMRRRSPRTAEPAAT